MIVGNVILEEYIVYFLYNKINKNKIYRAGMTGLSNKWNK